MSVNAAGSAINVQQALVALRQSVQVEQVAAAAVTEAAAQGARDAAQQNALEGAEDGRGEKVDVEA